MVISNETDFTLSCFVLLTEPCFLKYRITICHKRKRSMLSTEKIKENADAAARYIQSHIHNPPHIMVLTGTGLSESVKGISVETQLEYQDIPHFPLSTVESHPGKLIIGRLHDKTVAVFQGRFHLYEGYSPPEVAFPVRVSQRLGVQYLIVSNAAGGLKSEFSAGDIMLISDHINLTGCNPLLGPHDPVLGDRFPDMTRVYAPDMIALALDIGKTNHLHLQTGVYAGLLGPSLETPAETRFLKMIGASAVGFSTIMEVITAVQAGMKVIGLSTITNINNPDHPVPATLEDIIETANRTTPTLKILIEQIIKHIDASGGEGRGEGQKV